MSNRYKKRIRNQKGNTLPCELQAASRIRGITEAAAALRVTRQHLWQVLTGKRISPKLLARYIALRNAQQTVLKNAA